MLVLILVRLWGTFVALRRYPCLVKPHRRVVLFVFFFSLSVQREIKP